MKKFLLILLIVVLVIIIALAVICSLNKQKIANYAVEKSMEMAKTQVMANLPQSVPADSAKILMDGITAKIKSGELDKEEVQHLVSNIQQAFSDGELDSTETVKLLDTIEKILEPAVAETADEPVEEPME
ncbi:hypothetical protein JW992_05365 [candidate division KSB1 bacterium]|nr:hypothetical protein [candidate division KSB1 bacterium]